MQNFQQKIRESDGLILVAFSGGKDSIAMVLYLLELGIDKARIHLHHHLVDGAGDNIFDWPCTESYCQAFADALGLSLFFSYRKGGIAREIYRKNEPLQDVYYQVVPGGPFLVAKSRPTALNTRLKFPAISANLLTRWCSSTAKIDVLRAVICHNPTYRGEIFILTGERRQESPGRSKYSEIQIHTSSCSYRQAFAWRPILDWTEEMVWAIMKKWRIQPHPAYMLGWSRCSCQTCIFNHADLWATIQHIDPAKIVRIANIEKEIGHTLYAGISILEKINRGVPNKNLDIYWTNQAILFSAPILINNWAMPAGAYQMITAGAA